MSLPALLGGSQGFSLFGTPSTAPIDKPDDRPLHPNQEEAISRLNAAFAESASYDWDDEGASPASQLSRLYAERFLLSLKASVEPPDVSFSRSGDALLEWHPARGRIALVKVSGSGELAYAVQLPGQRMQGLAAFSGAIPDRLLSALLAALRL
jgi:hypothetical protein